MTKINKNTNASYNFKAPEIARDADKKVEVNFPTSEKINVAPLDGVVSFNIDRQFMYIDLGEIVEDEHISLAGFAKDVDIGAILVVRCENGGIPAVTIMCDEDLKGRDVTVEDGESVHLLFFYNGVSFQRIDPVPKIPKPITGSHQHTFNANMSVDVAENNAIHELEIPYGVDAQALVLTIGLAMGFMPKFGDRLLITITNFGDNNTVEFVGVKHATTGTLVEGQAYSFSFMYDGASYIATGDAEVQAAY